MNLWRATELNPAVFVAGATTGNTNQRRLLIRQNPVEGQYYGTIGHVDDTGRVGRRAHDGEVAERAEHRGRRTAERDAEAGIRQSRSLDLDIVAAERGALVLRQAARRSGRFDDRGEDKHQ